MTELASLGWSEFFAKHLVASSDLMPARVIAEHRSRFQIETEIGECSAHISGKLRHEARGPAEMPAVGDWVVVQSLLGDAEAVIQRVLPRKSKFSRKTAGDQTAEQVVAANADTVWIVGSLDQDFSLRRMERYLTLAWASGANPVIVLTKSDLCDNIDYFISEIETIAVGTSVHCTSSLTGAGLGELQAYFRNHATVALLGSSGVGKSALINALAGSTLQRTGEVREDGKGRHTTTYRQLIRLPNGGLIIDTPGMRELQLWEGQQGLTDVFCEIDELAKSCRFSDCRHAGEPGCAVVDAVTQGTLPECRLQSYQKLQRELAHLERKQSARAQHDEKQRIKNIMKSLRHHPKYKR